ncbi:hypothetical protein H5410_001499 [Solanum commersonii]|uniref:Bet v I/Major latex protein domain-containing protein n=1 Tax=Solanum commersonii TaxID=4109 RepID=A0A9J6AZ50_SOLCO|nr:hypothetical protein H5410_001499 [Solanum commersonii]
MKYNEEREEKIVKYEVEAMDRYKKSISRKVIDGDLLDFYSSFTFVSSCEQQWITWTFEYEKKIEDNLEPFNFLGFILNLTKNIEGHFQKIEKIYCFIYVCVLQINICVYDE